MKTKLLAAAAVSAMFVIGAAAPSQAANLAVFGNNSIGNYYAGLGNSVSFVSDAQLSSAGFLNSFDAFVMTRDGFSFGTGLSVAAAVNVKSFVGATGNVVLFNGDFSDGIAGNDANTKQLFSNALAFATLGGKGFIGEFNGAVSAFASNSSGFTPLGFVNGAAGPLGGGNGGSSGAINATPQGMSNPLLAGVNLPYNDTSVEFGADLSGFNPAGVVLAFDNGNPALIASNSRTISVPGVVPEPGTWALMIGGFGMAGAMLRRRRALTA